EGPVGAHNPQYVCAPDWDLFQEFYRASAEKLKIITLSPEWPEAVAFTKKCVAHGVLVAIGHTAANSTQITAVVDAGAKMSTHLGNGSHQILPRHPNYIWDQLADDRLAASIIGDGFHLPEAVIKVIQKVKGDKTILVSDSVSLTGWPPGNYTTPVGGQVILTQQGKLHLAGKPDVLAGSAQTLLQAIVNLYDQKQYPLADAWNIASINPARLLDQSVQNGLQEGAPADLVLFRQYQDKLQVLATYKKGDQVFTADKI
ncbi:MAG: N-acetylglucosamine-6-phosphate deacetylase, partial [Sphingobacteriaceae bacterium]